MILSRYYNNEQKQISVIIAAAIIAIGISGSAYAGLNYNASKSNTGNITIKHHTGTNICTSYPATKDKPAVTSCVVNETDTITSNGQTTIDFTNSTQLNG